MKYDQTRKTFRTDDDRWHGQSHHGNGLRPLDHQEPPIAASLLLAMVLLLSTLWVLFGTV